MIGTIIGILGTFLTILFGVYSVRITRNNSKANSLSFSMIQCLSLFDSIVDNIDDIEVKYRGSPVNKSVLLFEGKILNNTRKDIDKLSVHSPLKIIVPNHFEILECNISSTSNKISAICNSTKYQVQINWDLLKRNEYIEFKLLVNQTEEQPGFPGKTSVRKLFYNKLKFDFRITNIDSIKKESFDPKIEEIRKREIKIDWWAGGISTALGITLFLTSVLTYNFLGHDKLNNKVINKLDNKEYYLTSAQILNKDKEIKIKSIEGDKSTITLNQLNKNYEFSAYVIVPKGQQPNYFNYFLALFGISYIGYGGITLYNNYNKSTSNK